MEQHPQASSNTSGMDRRQFVAVAGVASAVALAGTAVEAERAAAQPATGPAAPSPEQVDDRFLDVLTTVNNLLVSRTIDTYRDHIDSLASPRTLAQGALRLVTGYVNPRGENHHNADLLDPVATLLSALADRQNPSGLFDIGNLDSPPDTSFVISDLGLSYGLLQWDDRPATASLREQYATIMRKATRSLVDGGVHTPNHRWEICKALAYLNHYWPGRATRARINDWLGEGIDQDADGDYSERSPIYASEVTNRSLLIIARLADKPELVDPVRRNLALALYRLEPNGELEAVHSRRQDQTRIEPVWKYLTQYRQLALLDDNGQFAAVAEQIVDQVEADPASYVVDWFSVGEFLSEALAYPDLTAVLPGSGKVPDTYTHHSKASSLVRIRRGDTTASIFGGTDWHNPRLDSAGNPTSIREIASGLSTNPTFFKFRKGEAILDSVRLSPRFFSTGHFRSNGIRARRRSWQLSDRVKVPYHLPLPQRYRNDDGDYALGSEGRFYSKLDFPDRPKQYLELTTSIMIREVGDGAFDLDFEVDGPNTSLTIELVFRSGGSLTAVGPADGDGNHQLVDGEGRYTVGNDTIAFGPGNGDGIRQPISMDPGEKYTYLGGNLVPGGERVYITGMVPFRYTLRLR